MPDPDLIPAILHRLHANQLAIGSAVEELAIWIDQRGSTDVADRTRNHLAVLEQNADFISGAIVELLAAEGPR